ncbi:hypothetical protein [Microbacterium sp. B19]|uniref:hypothetical protein n=1 Tax=Microbacterium sp. B19 TaxID=96765 RepID=UPI0003B651D4|nr:hypothetical protein [Microbacterium sp. B19]
MTTSATALGLIGLLFPLVLTGLSVWFAVWVILTLKRIKGTVEELHSRLGR